MSANEKKEVTAHIDEELYMEILQYLAEHDIDMSIFVEQALKNELNMKREKNMENLRTLAFQVSEEFFQRIKTYLRRYDIKQKDFVIGLIEKELNREQAEREKAGETQEENAPVEEFEVNSEESENTAEEQPEGVDENNSETFSEEAEDYIEEQEDTDIGETEDFGVAEFVEQPEAAAENDSEPISEEMEEYAEEQDNADISETEDFGVVEDNNAEDLSEGSEDEYIAADALYPYIKAVWSSDGKSANSLLENSAENIATFILRHKDDGEISFLTPDDIEMMTAYGGAVVTASDTDYLDSELNSALSRLASRKRLPKVKEVISGEEQEYTESDAEEAETSEPEDEETAPVMAM